jgi:hypothetical protein
MASLFESDYRAQFAFPVYQGPDEKEMYQVTSPYILQDGGGDPGS